MSERIGCYAPGNYSCICSQCNIFFKGDKRAVTCKSCARELRIKELESSLQRFIDQAEEVKIRRELTSLETVHLEECKQILEKGK